MEKYIEINLDEFEDHTCKECEDHALSLRKIKPIGLGNQVIILQYLCLNCFAEYDYNYKINSIAKI